MCFVNTGSMSVILFVHNIIIFNCIPRTNVLKKSLSDCFHILYVD